MKSKIFIVEDNKDILFNIKLLLELNNYEIEIAENGKEGLKKLEKLTILPDLILCDIMMPMMDGYEFFKRVIENPNWSHIPMIFLSAKSSPEDIRFGKLLGIDDYITKPYDENYLLDVINGKIERNKMNNELIEIFKKKIEKIENLEKPSIKKSQIEEILIFHVDWDDSIGPNLVSEYTPKKNLNFDTQLLGMQLFQTTVAIYGHKDYSQAKSVLLNIDNINMDAVIFFDSIIDKNIRGNQRQFMLAVIAPKINYFEFLKIKIVFSEISLSIKESNGISDMKTVWTSISKILTED